MRKVFIASFLAVSIAATTGCQQLGINKEQFGTVAGGVAGALIGSQVGGGNGRILAILIGGAAGSYLGNRVGSMLDERDREALALQTQQALLSAENVASTSQPVVWKSAHSGATAQIKQGKSFETSKPVEVKRVASIQAVPNMTLIQAPYVTLKSSNVRAAPSTSADKVGGLQPGTEFTAVGSTGDWIMVARKGVTVGYVYKNLVAPKESAVAKSVQPSFNLDTINVASSDTKGFDLDSLDVKTTSVSATSTCRPVSISLKTASGKSETEDSTFCKQGNGTWELI